MLHVLSYYFVQGLLRKPATYTAGQNIDLFYSNPKFFIFRIKDRPWTPTNQLIVHFCLLGYEDVHLGGYVLTFLNVP